LRFSFFPGFGISTRFTGWGNIFPVQQHFLDFRLMNPQIITKLIDLHPVHPWTTLVAANPLQRRPQVIPATYLLHQIRAKHRVFEIPTRYE
jgi:hypothetical protein